MAVVVDCILDCCWLDDLDDTLEAEDEEEEGGAEDDWTEDDEVTPVDRLTCLFSSFANAASMSLAAPADTDTTARKVKDFHQCILFNFRVR